MAESNKLYNSAHLYRDFGWSVVPIWGSRRLDSFKAAAVRWRDFQTRHPTDSELHHWFVERNFGGLAIVCGEVSRLAVLDFDDPKHATAFAQLYPDLTETYTVRSGGRGLPHLYFHIPAHLGTRSRHAPGVDWQYNGAYVIAPPTSSADGTWAVERGNTPKILSERDLSRIMGFIDGLDHNTPQNGVTPLSARSSDIPGYTQTSPVEMTGERIVRYYRERVGGGRNKALFETCCWLRDNGGTPNEAMVLVGAHVSQSAPSGHRAETAAQRREEALKTILSAFSRGPLSQAPSGELRVIPNGLREKLLSEKKTAVLRVLEAIHDASWKPGDTFTRTELVEVAQSYDVGDWSVRKALAASAPGNHAIFPEVAKRANAAVLEGVAPPQLNAIELRVSGPTENLKRGRGRPTVYYVVPSLRALCKLYDVTLLVGDAIDMRALGSVKHYRQALHTALLARRPGQYHRHWLAGRLGVSVRTICRYNNAPNIRVSPRYDDYPVIWQNLHNVVPSGLNDPLVSHYGAFLEDDRGKRYPPFVPIARTLLSKKRKVRYKRRRLNHYSVIPDCPPPRIDDPPEDSTTQRVAELPLDVGLSPRSVDSVSVPSPGTVHCAEEPVAKSDSRPLSASEQEVVTLLCEATRGTLSQARAASLVQQYGPFAVRHVVRTLEERGDTVQNPAGFAVQLLATRYGTDGDRISAAEGVYLALQKPDGKPGVSWARAQQLVKTYGVREVSLVLREMHQRDDILNPVGFLVSSLKRNTQTAAPVANPDEAVARLCDAVRERCPKRALSRQKARQLVRKYGTKAVMQAVSVIKTRENIDNPAGFVIVYLRSEAKARHGRQRG